MKGEKNKTEEKTESFQRIGVLKVGKSFTFTCPFEGKAKAKRPNRERGKEMNGNMPTPLSLLCTTSIYETENQQSECRKKERGQSCIVVIGENGECGRCCGQSKVLFLNIVESDGQSEFRREKMKGTMSDWLGW